MNKAQHQVSHKQTSRWRNGRSESSVGSVPSIQSGRVNATTSSTLNGNGVFESKKLIATSKEKAVSIFRLLFCFWSNAGANKTHNKHSTNTTQHKHSTNTTQHTKHKKGKRLSTHPGDDEQEAPDEKENAGDVGLVLWGRNLQRDSGVSSHGGCHGSACVSWVGSCCLCALPGALTAASHGWLVSRVCGERACGVWVCAWCVRLFEKATQKRNEAGNVCKQSFFFFFFFFFFRCAFVVAEECCWLQRQE